jgi:hypothetical protein
MITIKNTENLTGVSISGDYNDLEQLVESLLRRTMSIISSIIFTRRCFLSCLR